MGITESFFRTFSALRGIQLQEEQNSILRERYRADMLSTFVRDVSTLPLDAREAYISQIENTTGVEMGFLREVAARAPETPTTINQRAYASATADGTITRDQSAAMAAGTTSSALASDRVGALAGREQENTLKIAIEAFKALPAEEQLKRSEQFYNKIVLGATQSAMNVEDAAANLTSNPEYAGQVAQINMQTALNAAQAADDLARRNSLLFSKEQFRQQMGLQWANHFLNERTTAAELDLRKQGIDLQAVQTMLNDEQGRAQLMQRAAAGQQAALGEKIQELRQNQSTMLTMRNFGLFTKPGDRAQHDVLRTRNEQLTKEIADMLRAGAMPAAPMPTPMPRSPLAPVTPGAFLQQFSPDALGGAYLNPGKR